MHTATPDRTDSGLKDWLLGGVVAFGLATALSAIGVFAGERQQDQVDAFPVLVVFLAIMTGLVFGLAVRPATEGGASSRRVAVLGGLAFLGIAVFWAGLPAILGVAALVVRRHVPPSRPTTFGVVLASLALLANVIAAFVG